MGKFFKDVNRKEAISWALYDFANSAYVILILIFVFPIFFREVIAGGGASADFWWGLAIGISILLSGLASPIIGSIADYDKRRKRKFIIFTLLSIIGTSALFFTGPNMLLLALILFIVTNFCFQIAQTLYDSFLFHVSTKETVGRISGFGWGLGYLGGIVAILVLRPLYESGYASGALYKLTFPLAALFFLIFALPAFLFIKEHKKITKKEKFSSIIKIGISNTFRTLKGMRQHKNIAWFLVGFYILSNALATLSAFGLIYANVTLKMTLSELTIFALIIQLIAFPATIFFGWLSDKKGSKKILLISIALWVPIILTYTLTTSKIIFYVAGGISGLVLGSSQSIARSWFSKIIPKEKRCEFFGFNGFASKVATATGPFIFGIISLITGNQRIAMGSIVIYFIISFLIFARIKNDKESIAPDPLILNSNKQTVI